MNDNKIWEDAAQDLARMVTDQQLSLPGSELQSLLASVEGGQRFATMAAKEFASVQATLREMKRQKNL